MLFLLEQKPKELINKNIAKVLPALYCYILEQKQITVYYQNCYY